MRIRAGHIVVAAIVAVSLFVFLATAMREARPSAPGTGYDEGLAPPAGASIEEAPCIELETSELLLGPIPHDRDTEVKVRVFNRGGSELNVREVRSSCPLCTRGHFAPGASRIPPGQSSDLLVTVLPSGIPGFHSVKTLSLSTNDPRAPSVQLTVTAEVDPEFVLEPEEFNFGVIEKGAEAQATMVFRQRIDAPIAVEKLTLTYSEEEKPSEAAEHFTLTMEALPEDAWAQPGKREYRFTMTTLPYLSSGDFEQPVFIHTDLKRFPAYRTLARGTVVAPYQLVFKDKTRTLFLRRRDEVAAFEITAQTPFVVTSLLSEKGFMVLSSEEIADGQTRIQCEMAPQVERGVLEDAVKLEVAFGDKRYMEHIPARLYSQGDVPDASTTTDPHKE